LRGMRLWRRRRVSVLLCAGAAGRPYWRRDVGKVGGGEGEFARVDRAGTPCAEADGETRRGDYLHVERDRSLPGARTTERAHARCAGGVRAHAAAANPATDAKPVNRARYRSDPRPG